MNCARVVVYKLYVFGMLVEMVLITGSALDLVEEFSLDLGVAVYVVCLQSTFINKSTGILFRRISVRRRKKSGLVAISSKSPVTRYLRNGTFSMRDIIVRRVGSEDKQNPGSSMMRIEVSRFKAISRISNGSSVGPVWENPLSESSDPVLPLRVSPVSFSIHRTRHEPSSHSYSTTKKSISASSRNRPERDKQKRAPSPMR